MICSNQINVQNTDQNLKLNLSLSPKVNGNHFNIPKRSCFSPPNQIYSSKPMTAAIGRTNGRNLNKSVDSNDPSIVPWEKLINYEKIMFDKVNEHELNQTKQDEFRSYLNFQVAEKQKRKELESKISQVNEILNLRQKINTNNISTEKIVQKQKHENHLHREFLLSQINNKRCKEMQKLWAEIADEEYK